MLLDRPSVAGARRCCEEEEVAGTDNGGCLWQVEGRWSGVEWSVVTGLCVRARHRVICNTTNNAPRCSQAVHEQGGAGLPRKANLPGPPTAGHSSLLRASGCASALAGRGFQAAIAASVSRYALVITSDAATLDRLQTRPEAALLLRDQSHTACGACYGAVMPRPRPPPGDTHTFEAPIALKSEVAAVRPRSVARSAILDCQTRRFESLVTLVAILPWTMHTMPSQQWLGGWLVGRQTWRLATHRTFFTTSMPCARGVKYGSRSLTHLASPPLVQQPPYHSRS